MKDIAQILASVFETESKSKPEIPGTVGNDLFKILETLPPKERSGRGLSKENTLAQATVRRYTDIALSEGKVAPWVRIKSMKNKAAANQAVYAMRRSEHWNDFDIESRNVDLFVRLKS